jgi:ABC-2 type transport system ATP-binding protein
MITIKNLNKSFGNDMVLKDINLKISNIFGILGPNGAGKSTLIKILATTLIPNSGTIELNGIKWSNYSDIRRKIGYLPQHFNMLSNLTLHEALEYFAILKNVTLTREISEDLLYKVNLLEQKNKKVKNLSGGMLRRLGIAQALLGDPDILIIDEPLNGLDIEEKARFGKIIKQIGSNKIVIISSHQINEIDYLCESYTILNKGEINFVGTAEDLKNKVRGYIWEKDIDSEYLEVYLQKKNTITLFRNNSSSYKVHIFSKEFIPDAQVISPSIEESYLILQKGLM